MVEKREVCFAIKNWVLEGRRRRVRVRRKTWATGAGSET